MPGQRASNSLDEIAISRAEVGGRAATGRPAGARASRADAASMRSQANTPGRLKKRAVGDRPRRIQFRHSSQQARHRPAPSSGAVQNTRHLFFDSCPQRPGQARQIGFARSRAFVVAQAGDHASARRACAIARAIQRACLLALARRQHQHQRITRRRAGISEREAGALQRIGLRLEALLADQPRERALVQRPTVARAQEQRAAIARPRQRAVEQRQQQGFERGIGTVERHGRCLWN